MKKYSTLAAAAVVAAMLAPAAAEAATMSLSLTYVGSTSATTATGLSVKNLADPTFQTTAWHHYFDIFASFTTSSGEAFRAMTFDVLSTGSWAPCTAAGVVGGTVNKYIPNNPVDSNTSLNVFTNNADGGTAGDDLAIFVAQTDVTAAYISLIGQAGGALGVPSKVGRVGFEFTAPLAAGQNATIEVSEAAGQSFSFFSSSAGGVVTQAGGITSSATITVVGPNPVIPEPASLGLLTLGGLALIARRRRSA